MDADRYAPPPLNRGSLTLSLTICGSLLAAALASPTVVRHFEPDRGLPVYPVPIDPPPPPEPQSRPAPLQKTRPTPRAEAPTPLVRSQPDTPFPVAIDPQPPFDPGPATGAGAGGGTAIVDPPRPPPPVLTQPGIDQRYARDFQPGYPPAERRAGREGSVVVRVLVGVDGRVRDIEQISAASDEFWRVTRERALARWRFRPGTRDGIPVEAWRTMTVRFLLQDDG